MLKKAKNSPASFVKKVAKRAVENPAVKSAMGGLMSVGVPAGVGLVGSRLVSYLADRLSKRGGASAAKWQRALAPHAATLASLFFFAITWYATSKSKTLKKYKTGALIGAGLATVLTVAQSYFFKKPQLSAPTSTRRVPPSERTNEQLTQPDEELQLEGDDEGMPPEYGIDGTDGIDGNDGPGDLGEYQTGIFAPN